MSTMKCGHDQSEWRMRCFACGHVTTTDGEWHSHNGMRAEFGYCKACKDTGHQLMQSDLVGWYGRCSCGEDCELQSDWQKHQAIQAAVQP